ncbi:MAG: energy-coupling factor ABC transporter permease [Reinekea sp.]
MNTEFSLFPVSFNVISNLLFFCIVTLAIVKVSWAEIRSDDGLQHRIGFATVVLVTIWSLRAGVSEGLGIHFYLITAFHLIFGWQVSIALVFLVQLGMIAVGNESWMALGTNGITSGLIPICVTYLCWKWTDSRQHRNPFTFIFGTAFLGAILSVVVSILLLSFSFMLFDIYDWEQIANEYILFIPLVALPEGILNGMLVASLIIFKPQWVAMYDEKRYIL